MKIYRKYYDESRPEEISLQEAIEKLEGKGYYKSGTAENLLGLGEKLQTNAAEYYAEAYKYVCEECGAVAIYYLQQPCVTCLNDGTKMNPQI